MKLSVVSIGFLSGAMAMTWAAYRRPPDGMIPQGVHIVGADLGGKRAEEAHAALTSWRDARRSETLTLALPADVAGGRKWTPTRADLGFDVDVDATVSAALQASENQGPLARLGELIGGPRPVEVAPRWKTNLDAIRKYLKRKVARRVQRDPHDARFLPQEQGFTVVPERAGTSLDLDACVKVVAERGRQLSTEPIPLAVRTVPPHVTAADLTGIEGEVSRFETHYGETGNRRRNIEVACSHINGVVLKPGDVFSYNKVVGPRDSEYGFRIAPVIIRGRLQPGLGGGVCQVSSTLYNAVLLADLKIVRRSHHAFPVHYLPAGRDATVAYDSVDFRFQNDTNGPIAIASSGTGGRVLMRVFGKPEPGRQVRIERTGLSSWGAGVETVHDSSLRAGATRTIEKGHAGHRVTVWRIVTVNGQQTRREKVSQDHYDAFPAIVAVGTRPRPARPAPSSPSTPSTPPAVPPAPAAEETPPG